jgi:RimJ/RimL family protein N-acetyltransferase
VNLKIVEKEDLPSLLEWFNDPEFHGRYNPLVQLSMAEMEKCFDRPNRPKSFLMQKKDGTKVGIIESRDVIPNKSDVFGLELAYSMLPGERGKGYCTEAINLLLDFLFLSSAVARVQVITDTKNAASLRVLEKTGFRKEGTIRKFMFSRGEWRDGYLCSILREEWKGPRVLKDTA